MTRVGLSSLLVSLIWAGCNQSSSETCEREPSFFYQPGLTPAGASAGQATRLSLAHFCHGDPHVCPPNALAAKQGQSAISVSGCGLESVQTRVGDLAGWLWVYDSLGTLVGAASHDDVTGTLAGCTGFAFQAGDGPPLPADVDQSLVGPHRLTCANVVVVTP